MRHDPETHDFDAFGDPLAAPLPSGDRRARRVAVVLFWSAALLLTAGRIAHPNLQGPDHVASLQAPITLASR